VFARVPFSCLKYFIQYRFNYKRNGRVSIYLLSVSEVHKQISQATSQRIEKLHHIMELKAIVVCFHLRLAEGAN